ncbi:MAG TPA: DUF6582 domain-containing protein [Candidatus Acidoferrum sp.]|nr:DUF6582 domain-containing protein [Candidatus Acidoferrum sp.]
MPGKMPERKSFGRREPPQNYPIDPRQYADPQNYMYPLDKPIRAKLARRYFDEPRNRSKYTEEERFFIDSRIDEALKKFSIVADEAPAPRPRNGKRKSPKRIAGDELGKLDLEQLLQRFLGSTRLERAKSIPDSLVSLSGLERNRIAGNVKQYSVRIDLKNRVITHDCDDWKKNMRSRLMCKHLGKAFLAIGNARATTILRQILSEIDDWTFNAP